MHRFDRVTGCDKRTDRLTDAFSTIAKSRFAQLSRVKIAMAVSEVINVA